MHSGTLAPSKGPRAELRQRAVATGSLCSSARQWHSGAAQERVWARCDWRASATRRGQRTHASGGSRAQPVLSTQHGQRFAYRERGAMQQVVMVVASWHWECNHPSACNRAPARACKRWTAETVGTDGSWPTWMHRCIEGGMGQLWLQLSSGVAAVFKQHLGSTTAIAAPSLHWPNPPTQASVHGSEGRGGRDTGRARARPGRACRSFCA